MVWTIPVLPVALRKTDDLESPYCGLLCSEGTVLLVTAGQALGPGVRAGLSRERAGQHQSREEQMLEQEMSMGRLALSGPWMGLG